MSVASETMARITRIAESADVVILPVGDRNAENRGLTTVGERWPSLGSALKKAFGIAVLATGIQAAPAMAGGVGYDANVYGQSAGQVMTHGQGIPAKVVGVRPIMIELAQEQPRQNAIISYGVPAAAAGVGGVIGHKLGGKSSAGQQIGAIVGGLAGGLAGALAVDAMNGPREAQQIPGVELTVRNPVTNNIAVITQAGEMQFSDGDDVLVVSMGNTVRVVPDRGRNTQMQAFSNDGQSARRDTAMAVVKTANTLGLRIDPTKVAMLIEPGPVPNQVFGGKVVGVDHDRGLVYQELGRGDGAVHAVSKLTRIPVVGEYVRIQYAGGLGNVAGKQLSRNGKER